MCIHKQIPQKKTQRTHVFLIASLIFGHFYAKLQTCPLSIFGNYPPPQMVPIPLDINIGEFPGFGGFDSGSNLQPNHGTNGTRPIFRVVKLFVALALRKSAIQHDSFLGLSRWAWSGLGLKTRRPGRLGRCFFCSRILVTFWTP